MAATRRSRHLLALLLAAAGIVAGAAEALAQAPACPAAGTVARLSNGWTWTYLDADGAWCRFRAGNKIERQAHGLWLQTWPDGRYGAGVKAGIATLAALFPLEAGRKASFDLAAAERRRYGGTTVPPMRQEVSVLRREIAVVPAGSFDAFVVEWRDTVDRKARDNDRLYETVAHAVWTMWYVPSEGMAVKVRVASQARELGKALQGWEVVQIARP
ncbi:MAG: hypothetical protein JNK11_01950 [Alphaproteobacteria bacterium]|nr:hypothetical protein [Alphaproteobacteria bacterium]